jgi:hypothetical protein
MKERKDMDELDMLRAVRPLDIYPERLREATRTRLLTEAMAAGPGAAGVTRHAPAGARGPRRTRRAWQAGLAAVLAAGAVAVTGTYLASGARPHGIASGPPAPAISATRVLLLAADAAQASAPPPGARWVVWEDQVTSSAWRHPDCGGTVKSVTAQAYGKLPGVLRSCPAAPPASLPVLRRVKTVSGGSGYPDMGTLPDQPGPLLAAVERWTRAHWTQNADHLPGQPVPALTRPELYAEAFAALQALLQSGVTSPSRSVQLRALALIPGTKVATSVRNAAGLPGIAVTITSADAAQTGFSQQEIIFDPHTYQDIGGVLVQPDQYAAGGSVTISTARMWQAYYDAAGRRV